MRILFLTDNFPPETNAPATRTYEHCLKWIDMGYKVTVITCFPNFPKGKVFEGYTNKLYQKENIDETDIAKAISISVNQRIIGIRPGEKIHEQMIGLEDAPNTFEYKNHYKILPAIHNWSTDPARIKDGIKVADNFIYTSDNNKEWMSSKDLAYWIDSNKNKIGLI